MPENTELENTVTPTISIGDLPEGDDNSPKVLGVDVFGKAELYQLGTASTINVGSGVDDIPTVGYVDENYQEKLLNGQNIKTLNGMSLLGSGNVTVSDTVGTVTSVGINMPTGFNTGNSVTTSGNLQVSFTSGYSLVSGGDRTLWDSSIRSSGSTIDDVTITQTNIVGASIGRLTQNVGNSPTNTITSVNGNIQVVTLFEDDAEFEWVLNSGEKILLVLRPDTFTVLDWGVDDWMTDVPVLSEENLVEVMNINGNLYAWDKGSRLFPEVVIPEDPEDPEDHKVERITYEY